MDKVESTRPLYERSRKDIETIMRFVSVAEYWLEQGDDTKALETVKELKRQFLLKKDILNKKPKKALNK